MRAPRRINGSSLAQAMVRAWAYLPFRAAQAIGAAIGWLHWQVPNRERRISADNLARCFPQRSLAWRHKLLRQSLIETGKTLAETLWLWGVSPKRGLRLVREVRGRDHLERCLRQDKGVIFATPHFGSWELVGIFLTTQARLTVMFRPPRAKWLSGAMHAGRERLGMVPVPADRSGIRALHRSLMRGAPIGILPDQAPRHGDGVLAPFFGVPALTMTLLPRLARRANATVLMTVMERLPRGRGFRLHCWPAAQATTDSDPITAASAVNREVERCVALAPHQYMWNYKRFRRRKR